MCTIMTVDRDTFEANKTEYLSRIAADELGNPHGIAIMMYSYKHGMIKLEANAFQAGLLSCDWDRVWLHCRYGTTETDGIYGCHNFASGDGWYIQHNGMVRCGDGLPVDSMAIAQLVKLLGPQDALKSLERTGETYANTFIVNEYGEYYVGRLTSGTLFTDGKGNYSSKQVATIVSPVATNSIAEYTTVNHSKLPEKILTVAVKLAEKGIFHTSECNEKTRKKLQANFSELELERLNDYLAGF